MLKSDKHVWKLSRVLMLLVVLMFSAMLALASVRAEGTATIWTDKTDYAPGETAVIYGSGFNLEASVSITVTRPDNSTDEWSVTSDSFGSFNTTYPLDGITGTYTVTATDGKNTATTTFTDAWPKYEMSKISGDGQSADIGSTLSPFVVLLTKQESSGASKVPQSGLTVTWTITSYPAGATGQSLSDTTTTTGADGKTSSTLTLGDIPGTYKVQATGPADYGSVTFTATATGPEISWVKSSGSVWTGVEKDSFLTTEDVYVTIQTTGTGSKTVDIYVVTNRAWGAGDSLVSYKITLNTITLTATTSPQIHGPYKIWSATTTAGSYDIIVDWNQNGVRDAGEKGDDIAAAAGFTVSSPTVSITVTSSPATGLGFVKVDGSAITTPTTFSWTPGDTHTLQALSPVPDSIDPSGTQYVWTSWSDGEAQTHTYTVPSSATTVTANYKTQFKLTLATDPSAVGVSHITASPSSSDGFYDIDTVVSLTADSPVGIDSTSRYRFDHWSGGASGTSTSTSVTMSTAKSVTANYVVQYYVTFAQSGVGTDFTGKVMTVGGVDYDRAGHSDWYDKDASITFDFKSPLVVTANVKRYVLTGVDASSPYTVSGSATVTGTYHTEYYITFSQTGVGTDFTDTVVTIDGTNYDRSVASFWWDDLSIHKFAFQSPLVVTPDEVKRYVWISTGGLSDKQSDDSFQVTGSGSITGSYKTQYYLTVGTSPAGVNNPTGQGWYDSGDTAHVSTAQYVDIVAGSSRYRFDSWTGATGTYSDATVVMDSAKTVTANYVTQYCLTLAASPSVTTPTGEGWYDEKTDASISTAEYVYPDPADGSRHRFDGWTTTDMTEIASASSTSTKVYMDKAKTVTANYIKQYYLTNTLIAGSVSSITASQTADSWYDDGTHVVVVLNNVWDASSTTRQNLYSYTVDGSTTTVTRANSGTVTLADIVMSAAHSVSDAAKTQYYLTNTLISGSVNSITSSPIGDSWYDDGTDVYVVLNYVWDASSTTRKNLFSYTIDASTVEVTRAGSGTFDVPKITMTSAHSVSDASKTQYYLTNNLIANSINSITPSQTSDSWYDADTEVDVVLNYVWGVVDSQSRENLISYTIDSTTTIVARAGSGTFTFTITMSTYHSVSDASVTQYYLTVSTNPAGLTPQPTVSLSSGYTTGDGYYDTSSVVQLTATSPIGIDATSRWRFDYWDIDGSTVSGNPITVTMDAAHTATAHYVKQYEVKIEWSGLDVDASGKVVTVTVDSSSTVKYAGDSFFDEFVDEGKDVSYTYEDIVSSSTTGKRFKLDTVTGTSTDASHTFLSIATPITETGNYKTQYYLTVGTSPAGVNSPTGQGWYDSGDTAHVSTAQYVDIVAGSSRYRFDSWTGATGTYADATVYMDAPKTATANYVVQYKLTVSTSPIVLTPQPTVSLSSGYTTGDGYYDTSSVVSIDPNSPAGYTFDHWNGDATGSTVPLSVTMNSAKNIIAVFTFNLAVETGFKSGDSPSFASDPYLNDIMCVLIKATTGYKLVGTSPGTFDYAIAIKNTGTTTFTSITISVTGSSDFVLQSSNPIRVLDATGADISAQFTISGTWPTITIQSKPTFQGLLGSNSLYVTIHLDYALKGKDGFAQFYNKAYTFTTTVTGTSGPNTGNKDAYGSVVFLAKKVTVIYGFVKTSSGAPIKDAKIELYQGGTLKYTETTDADGFYCFIDGWMGVSLSGGVKYTVKCTLPGDTSPFATQDVIAQSLKAVVVNFTKKE